MAMMPPSGDPCQPTILNAHFANAMGRADGCPCGNTQPPDAAIPRETGWLTHHICDDCGRSWTVDWKD